MTKIGIDFDNTIVTYDDVFYKYALKAGLISSRVKKNKKAIRDAIRALPNGNDKWTELQGMVYGLHMQEAKLMPGIERFLEACQRNSSKVCIISHKTKYPFMGPRVNLQQAAKQWIKNQNVFTRFGLKDKDIIFEETLSGKLGKISELGCDYFIDDLTEVLGHTNFPRSVKKILYGEMTEGVPSDIMPFDSWDAIKEYLLNQSEQNFEITRLPGGINSETYKVVTSKNKKYVFKKYHRRPGDLRDRMATEFSALSFMWAQGMRSIPQPILSDQQAHMAVYQFVEGKKIVSGRITIKDIDAAADFAGKLHGLRGEKQTQKLPVASEACFTIQAYIDNIEQRVANLRKIADKALIAFLDKDFVPYFSKIKNETVKSNKVLSNSDKTLSASDFGFHNALKTADGKIVFLDFEYFGWDDPIKMIADFYLQPAVPVPVKFRAHFFRKVRKNYREGKSLEQRLAQIYPILGLKWCLIMLNPFLRAESGQKIRRECLAKAKQKLKEVKSEVTKKVFPLEITNEKV